MSQDSIPKWILIVCGLICLLGLFVGGALYVSPGTFIPNVDFSSKGVRFLANMWAARQIAIAGIIGFSLLRKSVPMLRISLGAYVVMNVQDALIGVFGRDPGLAIGATLFGALAGFMCFRLGTGASGVEPETRNKESAPARWRGEPAATPKCKSRRAGALRYRNPSPPEGGELHKNPW